MRFRSPEAKQVTERTYDQYLSRLSLTEDSLKHRGLIVDVGAGLADFTEKVNYKFGSTGTKAVAVDPVYAFLDSEIEPFEAKLKGSGLFLELHYGRLPVKEGWDPDLRQQDKKQLILNFFKEVQKSESYVAGSHQAMPFRDKSIDLIVANNSLSFDNPSVIILALLEFERTLKDNGEFRVAPMYPDVIQWNQDRTSLVMENYRPFSEQEKQRLLATQQTFDRPSSPMLFELLRWLEAKGTAFYSLEYFRGEEHNPNETSVDALIGRNDLNFPTIDVSDKQLAHLRKLNFSKSDNYHIPSEIIKID